MNRDEVFKVKVYADVAHRALSNLRDQIHPGEIPEDVAAKLREAEVACLQLLLLSSARFREVL